MTDENFSQRIRDYLLRTENPLVTDVALLKVGRYRKLCDGGFLQISRNEIEGASMQRMISSNLFMFSPENFIGPVMVSNSQFSSEIALYFRKYSKIEKVSDPRIYCLENGNKTVRSL